MSLAKRLQELRAKKKVSLQVVADALGISKPHVWELEKGKTKNPSMELLTKLSSYYKTSLDYLVGNDNEEKLSLAPLYRKLNSEKNLTNSDVKVIEEAVDFALRIIKENNKGEERIKG